MHITSKCFLILALSFCSLTSSAQSCIDLFNQSVFPTELKQTPISNLSEPVSFHNKEVLEILKSGITKKNVLSLAQVVFKKGGFDIPIDQDGFVAAANVENHHGNYGNYIWLRDFARTNAGLQANVIVTTELSKTSEAFDKAKNQTQDNARRSAQAMLKLLEDPQWESAVLSNIHDPTLHLSAESGQASVIWIRRLLTPFKEHRLPTYEEIQRERDWGHKQNDALAVFAESILDAIKDGRINIHDLSPQAQFNFLLLPAYFVRLQYAKMWDVGAWEEQLASRTSSVGMVAEFLNRFREGFYNPDSMHISQNEKLFFQSLRSNTFINLSQNLKPEMVALISQSLSEIALNAAILEGQNLISERLLGAHPIETTNETLITRLEDTALLHLLWSQWSFLSLAQKLKLLKSLESLQRESGYARYQNDWFLYGGGEASKHQVELGLLNSLAIPDGQGGWKVATPEEAVALGQLHQQQMNSKDMIPVTTATGDNLEAQWTLPDSYLVQIYVDLYRETQNHEYLVKAQYHFARASALITGSGETNSEGVLVDAWRLPEAYVPVQVLQNGKLKTLYVVSPNSPLNWATSEYLIAVQKILTILD